MDTFRTSLLVGALALVAGCDTGSVGDGDGDGGGDMTADGSFVGLNGQTITGTAEFTLSGSTVDLVVEFSAAPPGDHGMHIHAMPACGNEGMDAGGHWDPANPAPENHHLPGTPNGHLGDLGNITIEADGTGTLEFSNPEWTLGDGGTNDVQPHAIIFHELMDDGTMPSSGARWGCALLTLQP